MAAVGAMWFAPVGQPGASANDFDPVEVEVIEEVEFVDEPVLIEEPELIEDAEPAEDAEDGAEVDPGEAAVNLLTLAKVELGEDVLAEATSPEWPVIAAYVVNILVGPEHDAFDAAYALPTVDYGEGAISYAEEIAGISAKEFADVDLAERLGESDHGEPADPLETEVLLRLVFAKELLLQDDIDLDALTEAEQQIATALLLLQDIVAD